MVKNATILFVKKWPIDLDFKGLLKNWWTKADLRKCTSMYELQEKLIVLKLKIKHQNTNSFKNISIEKII